MGVEVKYFGETMEAPRGPYCWPPPDVGEGLLGCASIVVEVPVCACFESSFSGIPGSGSCWVVVGDWCWVAFCSIGKNMLNMF